MQQDGEKRKEDTFQHNPVYFSAGLDLRTNSFREEGNDRHMDDLSMWNKRIQIVFEVPTF